MIGMTKSVIATNGRRMLGRVGAVALATVTLGGCYSGDLYGAGDYGYGYGGYGQGYGSGYGYDDGYYNAGYGGDCVTRYGSNYYDSDPYAYDGGYYGYDCYDPQDYRSGFGNIGFGGGWYNDYYYPGYGLSIFDRYGRGYQMDPFYLNYWGGRRAYWQRYRDATPRSARRPQQYRGTPVRPGYTGRDERQTRDGQRIEQRREGAATRPVIQRPQSTRPVAGRPGAVQGDAVRPVRPGVLRPSTDRLDRAPVPGSADRPQVIPGTRDTRQTRDAQPVARQPRQRAQTPVTRERATSQDESDRPRRAPRRPQ